MKNNVSLQLSARTNMAITEQDPFPGTDMVNTISRYANKFLPARTSFGPDSPVKKIYSIEGGLNPVFNFPLRRVATRLSEIELALDCYNVSELQFSTMLLKELLEDVKMPAVYKLAVQMEELAGEKRFQEVKELLRGIKKIIGWIMKHRQQPKN